MANPFQNLVGKTDQLAKQPRMTDEVKKQDKFFDVDDLAKELKLEEEEKDEIKKENQEQLKTDLGIFDNLMAYLKPDDYKDEEVSNDKDQ